jgi:signal transduction histidine kinase
VGGRWHDLITLVLRMPTYPRVVRSARALALTSVVVLAVLAYMGYTRNLMLFVFGLAIAMLVVADLQVRRERRRRVASDLEDIAGMRADLRKREQAARAEVELASRLNDDFLATVSHQLRTPLNAIVGSVHLLKLGIADDRDRAVSVIERNAFAQARLIDDLLDVSRMVKGRVTLNTTTQDLRSSVQAALETVRPAADAKHVDLVVAADAEVLVTGDASRLQQVVWNLLSNAVKFTPKDGRVSVEVDRVGSRARLRVTDTGEGIDAAFLPQVFEPFRQTRSRSAHLGFGLGLAIVRQIVELHGGTVVAESEGARRGSRFTVMMPIRDQDGAAAAGLAGGNTTGEPGLRPLPTRSQMAP